MRLKLQEAMEQVLKEHGTPMTASAIAYEINKQHLYERGDKLPVPSSQIHARAKTRIIQNRL